MARTDQAKNTLKSARFIRNLSSTAQNISDFVGKTDQDDLYRIQLNNRSTLNLNVVANKKSKAAIQLFALKGAKEKVLKAIGTIPFSDLTAKQAKKYVKILAARGSGKSRKINLDVDAGTYYLRVYQNQGDNRYRLNYAANSSLPTPPGNPPVEPPLTAFPAQTWVRQFGTANNDYAYSTAIDNVGDVYVGGVTTGSGAFNGSGLIAKYKKDGSQEWQRNLSLSGSVAVADVAVDASGNYYVTGARIDGVDSDAFVVKYDSAGNQQWLKTIKNTLFADAASSIFLNGNDVYITGIQRGAPAPLSQGKAFIAKYTTDGNIVNGFGNNGIVEFGNAKTTAASGITVANGSIYITGITDASLTLSNNQIDLTGGDAFVAGFNSINGNLLWNQTLSSGSGTDYARGIAVNGSDLYIVGQTAGALPSGSLPSNTYAGGDADAFLAKYTVTSNSGTLSWVKQVGGTGLDSAQAITIDPTGKIYLTGETNTGLFGTALGGSDAWIAQASSTGSFVSSTQIGTAQDDEAYSIVTDSAGALYVAGQTQGTFSNATSQNQGNYDIWLAKYG